MRRTRPGMIVALWLAGCASAPPRASMDRPELFPPGTYQHAVTLKLADGARHRFRGVVGLSSERIRVVGLGPLGTTMFRVTENLSTGALDVELFHESLSPHEMKLRRFYAVLRSALTLARGEPAEIRLAAEGDRPEALLRLSEYDENRVPRRIGVEAQGFSLDIEVVGYGH